jgi:hypothetical protein
MQETQNTEEVKQPLVGKFKPKRKFLNFVSAVNGARIRFIRDVAFLKGEKLSGVLEGAIFKVTICDEGTINFEEQQGTNLSDQSMIKRLIEEIDEKDVTGYVQKFVVSGLEFSDTDGKLCYLEVEHQKPIDKLKSLFDEEEKLEVSEKGLSLLDDLFGTSEDEDFDEDHALSEVMNSMIDDLSEEDLKTIVETCENPPAPNEKLKEAAETYMEKQFRLMNEEKITELEYRIEETQKEIIRYQSDAKMAQKKLDEKSESLKVLETRLESMKPGDEPNGYVFYVSEEIKDMDGLDETETKVATKIAGIMKLKIDVLMEILTGGYYKIKIAKKDDITNQEFELEKEIYQKIMSLDIEGKISIVDGDFQYRGKLNWHQLVGKMIRMGFEQEPEFDKLCQSNSYESKEEEKVKTEKTVEVLEVETSTEIKSKIIKTFNEETTLVIMGTMDHNELHDVEITDDYTGFGVFVGDKMVKASYESDGFISIMTLDNFKNWQVAYPEFLTNGGGVDSFLLPNFKGTISVTAKINGEFTNQFDLSDYIQHQLNDYDEDSYADIFLVLPEGTEVIKMDKYHQIPVSAIRDINIDKVVE